MSGGAIECFRRSFRAPVDAFALGSPLCVPLGLVNLTPRMPDFKGMRIVRKCGSGSSKRTFTAPSYCLSAYLAPFRSVDFDIFLPCCPDAGDD